MKTPELLAPAGDRGALVAALEAGADAVYLGLRALNARRLARNFDHAELAEAVRLVHDRGARVYLTLNTDLAEREVGMAARMLHLAQQSGVDAVLVRDPAWLALHSVFRELSFHFSTQTAATSSADLRAAATVGVDRVVLAREMTLDEIRVASQVSGVETEAFVQGALCFSVSGRCHLSSWLGGRSGNRGLCASPCRVPWAGLAPTAGSPAPPRVGETPFSMRDLTAAGCVPALAQAGVAALKIEGRMKNADWVRHAVALYRDLLGRQCGTASRPAYAVAPPSNAPHHAAERPATQPSETLSDAVRQLGAYSGRECTAGFLEGNRAGLTGTFGRPAGTRSGVEPAGTASVEQHAAAPDLPARDLLTPDEDDNDAGFCVDILVAAKGVECRCQCAGRVEQWRLPQTVVRRAHKAVPIGTLVEHLRHAVLHGVQAATVTANRPDHLLVPRAANQLVDRVAATVHRALRHREDIHELELPDPIRQALARGTREERNQLPLGSPPDRVRLEVSQLPLFLRHEHPAAMIVEGAQERNVRSLHKVARKVPCVVALPAVFFEEDIPRIERVLKACRDLRLTVEVNNWGGWWLARQHNLKIEAGPGLGVLNALAGRALAELGCANVTVSIEADRRQIEALTAVLPVACSIVVFGRPALLTTRVELAEEVFSDQILSDRRRMQIRGRREGGLWAFRPVEAFDLRGLRNRRIRAAHYVVDLVGADDPVADFRAHARHGDAPLRFNYNRTLQ